MFAGESDCQLFMACTDTDPHANTSEPQFKVPLLKGEALFFCCSPRRSLNLKHRCGGGKKGKKQNSSGCEMICHHSLNRIMHFH